MRCRHVQRHLLAFLEEELTPRQRGKVAMHLTACPACTSTLRGLQQTLHRVQTLDVPEPSPAFWEAFGTALHRRLRRADASHPARHRWQVWDRLLLPRPVLAAVAISLILAGSLPFLRLHQGQKAIPMVALSGGEETNLATELDFLKHLDLLEEVDVLEQFDTSL